MTLKNIRSIGAFIMCAALMFLATVTCFAADQKVTVSEIDGMSLLLSENMIPVTRSSKNTDKYFSVFGLDYNTTMQNFKNNDIYMQAMDMKSATIVTVTMTKNSDSQSIGDYKKLDAEKLYGVQDSFLSQSEYISCTPDQAAEVLWLLFDVNIESSNGTIKAYQANTVHNGMSISITMQHNGGNVNSADFFNFKSIVSSVNFNSKATDPVFTICVYIGIAIFVVVIFIILLVAGKKTKKSSKKVKNDKILKELAKKYTSERKSVDLSDYEDTSYEEAENMQDISQKAETYGFDEEPEAEEEIKIYKKTVDFDIDPKVENEEAEEIIAQSLEDSDGTKIYTPEEFKAPQETDDAAETGAEEFAVVEQDTETETETETENDIEVEAEEEVEEESETEENTADEENEVGEENKNKEVKTVKEVKNPDSKIIEIFGANAENNDEIVRKTIEAEKFDNSYDFFEEAPRKIVGIIDVDSADLRNAEDYDVLVEEEKRARKVETEQKAKTDSDITEKLAKAGGAVKNFFVHCGYFCTNVSRMIKRKRAMKKRQKAEAARRERERRRREMNRQRRDENGLVQVHRASQGRRPAQSNNRNTAQRRPSQRPSQRPPQGRNSQMRTSPSRKKTNQRPQNPDRRR